MISFLQLDVNIILWILSNDLKVWSIILLSVKTIFNWASLPNCLIIMSLVSSFLQYPCFQMRRQIGARHLNAQISNWLLLFLLIDFVLMVSIPHIHHIIILILIKLLRLPPRVLQTIIVTLVFLIIFLTVVELIHSLW